MKDKDGTDPKYIGPGVWTIIHQIAIKARTEKEQKKAIKDIKRHLENFPCEVCKKHALEYVNNHPMEDWIGKKMKLEDGKEEMIGLFTWTWTFHNAVNARLSKPICDWKTACSMYLKEGNCSETCAASG